MRSQVKNLKLATHGRLHVEWAKRHMPALQKIRRDFAIKKPFKNLRIAMALHITKETAVLVETLEAGGATVALASCNPLSTQDEVAAYLAKCGTSVFGHRGESKNEYYKFIRAIVATRPHLTIDDGCDLVSEIHTHHPHLIHEIIGGCEETTTGVIRLRAMEKAGALKYPIVAVNDNQTKHLFDNYYGTGQSTLDGIIRATNILIAGKTVVIAGYGNCGRGIALRTAGMGANVTVTEINPVRALQALMDGYRVMSMDLAVKHGDIFITATGNKHVITTAHIKKMKQGAILANSGHFNVEIDVEGLERIASKKLRARGAHVSEYRLPGRKGHIVYVIGEGRLVNLSAAEGHPSEVMALSFCGQALALEWLCRENRDGHMEPKVYTLPESIDKRIAALQLAASEIKIDNLTKGQEKYLSSWQEGT